MWYKERMAPKGIKTYDPSFDVTDNDLITGIVTEYGIAYPPYTESLRRPRRTSQTTIPINRANTIRLRTVLKVDKS